MTSRDAKDLVPATGELLVYVGDDGAVHVQVRLAEGTVWLTQKLMAQLYGVSVPTINEHLRSIFDEEELDPGATIRKFRIVQTEGNRSVSRLVDHYSLAVIVAVGYRVRSTQGTRFRQWATARLDEYLVKGFVLDDARLASGAHLGEDYFDELIERIRAIRASERRFYQKITDIYAQCSIDYDRRSTITQTFYATVQNKLHWAIHGQTAAELIHARAKADAPNMGLTSWKSSPHGPIRKSDVGAAKNYLTEEELRELNRVVTMFLDYAEQQARRRRAAAAPYSRPRCSPHGHPSALARIDPGPLARIDPPSLSGAAPGTPSKYCTSGVVGGMRHEGARDSPSAARIAPCRI